MLEKAGIILCGVSPCSHHIVIAPKKVQQGELAQKYLCVNYCALNGLLSLACCKSSL